MSVEDAPQNPIAPAPHQDEIVCVVHSNSDGFATRRPEMFAESFRPAERLMTLDNSVMKVSVRGRYRR
jgi:hypothetical protein